MARSVDNNGIGALYATFEINKTGEVYDLTSDNIGDAVVMIGNNTIGHGVNEDEIIGRLEYVAENLATVQIGGVVRLNTNTGLTTPLIGNRVVSDGAGKIQAGPALGNVHGRGRTLVVDTTNNTCDVHL